jgi:OPA family sugar phosphate sensor protein UhpC-like MFS transporter
MKSPADLLTLRKRNPQLFWQIVTLASMYFGYAALYMCRATVVIAGPAMLDDPVLDLTKTTWGAIIGWGTAGTLLGKITNGVLADRLGGRIVFLLSLSLCILATGLFASMSTVAIFSLAYFVALFAKSAGWPSMANLISVWYPENWRGRIWGILSSSSRFSSLFTALVLGGLLTVLSWRSVLIVATILAAAVATTLFFVLRQTPAEAGLEEIGNAGTDKEADVPRRPHALDEATLAEALLHFSMSPRFWLICCSVMGLTVLMEFQSFIPIYLKETFNLTTGIAAVTSSAFPIGCLISVLAGGFVFDLLSKGRRIFVFGGMMAFSVGCVGVLILALNSATRGDQTLYLALGSIMLFGLAIAPCYYIPMSVFAVDFGGKRCGVLVGIIDAAGYLAAMVFDFLGGATADQADGWEKFLFILFSVAIVATIALTTFLILDFRAQRCPTAPNLRLRKESGDKF